MRKKMFKWVVGCCVTGMLSACGTSTRTREANNEVYCLRTQETENLLVALKKINVQGVMFGHHDDTAYGIGWEGDEGRSDVNSVCGDYPAVIGFDLGELELGGESNLDKVPFEKIRKEICNHYQRGGLITLSWHARNPKTGGDAWDVTDSTVVRSILPGGEYHQLFTGWLKSVAKFISSLRTEENVKIPVLFRPWHEHTGNWFWWGEALCTVEDYKHLWTMTVDTLQAYGVDNALYAYSSGTEPQDTTSYLERYPGDEYIDLIGFDAYRYDDSFVETLERMLALTVAIAKQHGKAMALTEFGYEGIPDEYWWTRTVLPILEKYPIAYALVWRNARERVTHFYAPYPGQISADDFVEFYKHPKTLFVRDISSLYNL